MNISNIRNDLGAAIVGAVATLPQAVAYGLIAFSPLGPEWAVFGITASVGTVILFGIPAAIFGSNPFMLSGPRAVISLVLASGIQAALDRGFVAEEALLLGLFGLVFAGIFELAAGLLRLGSFVSYVPVPVLSGFVNASAVLVFLTAMPEALGFSNTSFIELLNFDFTEKNLWSLFVSGLTITAIFLSSGRIKIIPAALVGIVIGSVTYHVGLQVFALNEGPLVGQIDISELLRMPVIFTQEFNWRTIYAEIDIPVSIGLSIGLLNAFDTVLNGSALDLRTNQKSDANYDLRLHGLLNIGMGLLGVLPGSGVQGRSIAVYNAGAKTRAANIGSGIIFSLMLLFLAPLIALLPLWSAAGMLVATAIQAIEMPFLNKSWDLLARRLPYPRVVAGDVAITLTVIIIALTYGLIAAVGMGMFLSAVLFVFGMGRSPVRRMYVGSRVHSKTLRPTHQAEWLEQEGYRIAVIELQGALFFGSCTSLLETAKTLLNQGAEFIILDFKHLTSVDSTGCTAIRNLNLMCIEAGGNLYLSYVEAERRLPAKSLLWREEGNEDARRTGAHNPRWVWLNLEANGLVYALGKDGLFTDTDHALTQCENILLKRSGKSITNGFRGVIASSALFTGLSRDEIIDIGRMAKRHRFRKGETVFQQGDPGGRAYFTMYGSMNVLIGIPGIERKKRVSVLNEGALFGEMGLIDGDTRSASVVAAQNSFCFSIDIDAFKALRERSPDLVTTLLLNLSHLFSKRMRLANLMISELEQ